MTFSADTRVRLGVTFRLPLRERGHMRARLLDRDTRLQPRDDVDEIGIAGRALSGIESDRCPDLRAGIGKGKPGRHDADHRVRLFVQRDRLAKRVWIAAETALPEFMAQNHDLAVTGLVLLLREGAPETGLHSEQLKQIGRNPRADHPLRLVAAGEVEPLSDISRDPLEDFVLLLPLEEIRGRSGRQGELRLGTEDAHQLLGMRVRQRTQQDRVDHAENGAVRADGQAKRKNGDRTKRR